MYCLCGCGQQTKIARYNDKRSNEVKGQPQRYIKGHHRRGTVVSAETRARLSAALGGRGTSTNYFAIHEHLRKYFPKKGICESCGELARTHYALIHSRSYTRNREDYRELCSRCHAAYDQRLVCKRGHEMTSANRATNGPGKYTCRACRQERRRRKTKAELESEST